MAAAGIWQLQRGFAKEELQAQYTAAQASTPRDVTAGSMSYPGQIERASVRGRFDGNRQLLLDNQSHDGRPGYHVLTPLLLLDGGIAIVDRGWIPRPGGSELPNLQVTGDEIQVQGLWRTLPAPAMRLEVDNCADKPWPRLVQFPTIEDLHCLYGEYVAEGILLMDPDMADGYVRQWDRGDSLSPTKNFGYAAQWFAFALTLLGIYIKLNLRRKS